MWQRPGTRVGPVTWHPGGALPSPRHSQKFSGSVCPTADFKSQSTAWIFLNAEGSRGGDPPVRHVCGPVRRAYPLRL